MALDDAQISAVYARIRSALLARHTAFGRWYRANLLTLTHDLGGGDAATIPALPPGDQTVKRWSRVHEERENPLMFGGLLMAALAAEQSLGLAVADEPLRAMVTALQRHYRFSGDHFDGYPLRWDVPTSCRWNEAGAGMGRPPARSYQVLYGEDGSYDYGPQPTDPRWAPWRPDGHLHDLLPLRDRAQAAFNQAEFFDWFRRAEPSMDELCGLVAGYVAVARLATDPTVLDAVATQAMRLGDYLAEHGYLLVRPGGGFAARGSAGILPALELPFSRALGALGGMDASARTDFEGACRQAGVWPLLAEPYDWWTAAGVVAAVLDPLHAVLETAGLGLLLGAGTPLTSVQLAQTWAIYLHRDAFDVANDGMASEFAVAHALHAVPAEDRFHMWLNAAALLGGGYAGGFPPWIGLTALDDTDRHVADQYLFWFDARKDASAPAPGKDAKGEDASSVAGRSCVAAAVACLLGGGVAAEIHLAQRIEERIAEMGGADGADLELIDGKNGNKGKLFEDVKSAVDLVAGVALGWVHARRSQDAGAPVSVPGFPHLLPGVALPDPAVPGIVLDSTTPTDLPIDAIQGTPIPAFAPDGSAVIDWRVGRPAVDPVATVPPMSTDLVYDEVVRVTPAGGEIRTFAVVREGDALEITVDGLVEGWGPEGNGDIVTDARFPVHVGLDPVHAQKDALVARLNGYVVVGSALAKRQWLHFGERMLYLRLNRLGTDGSGSGAFEARVRVWSDRSPLQMHRFVTCIRRDSSDRDRRIDAVGGVHRDGTRWLMDVDEVIRQMKDRVRFFILATPSTGNEILTYTRRGTVYLRTANDGVPGNNLGNLPGCPVS